MQTILSNCNWKVLPITPSVVATYRKKFIDNKLTIFDLWGGDEFPDFLISNGKSVFKCVSDMNLKKDPVNKDFAKELLENKDLWVSKNQILEICKDASTNLEIFYCLEKITKGLVLRNKALDEAVSLDLNFENENVIVKIQGTKMMVYDKDHNLLAGYVRGVNYRINQNGIPHPTRPEDAVPTKDNYWCCVVCKNFKWLKTIERCVNDLLVQNQFKEMKFIPNFGYVSNRMRKNRKLEYKHVIIWYPYPRIVSSDAKLPKRKIYARDAWISNALEEYYKRNNINLGSVGNISEFRESLEKVMDKKFAHTNYKQYIITMSLRNLFAKQLCGGRE